MKCIIISIGDELLIGQVSNTNATWLCSTLTASGIEVVRNVVIPDRPEALTAILEEHRAESSLFVCTGGLGPTQDDRTKETLAHWFGMPLQMHEKALANIEHLFNARRRPLQDNNRRQAMLPVGARIFINPFGTASGMWFEKDGLVCIALPGVPFEMKALMEQIIPELQEREDIKPRFSKTLYTAGITESVLASKLSGWEKELRNSNLELAYLPSIFGVRLRITAPHGKEVVAQEHIEKLQKIVPKYLVSADGSDLPAQIGKRLQARKETMCTSESCSGGFLSHVITSIPGCSNWFMGGVVAYSNALKKGALGVDGEMIERHGAVSEEVVAAMATGARSFCHADFAVATSGIAGPGGGSDLKPVGTIWLAVSGPDEVATKCLHLNDNRERNIARASFAALNMLRLMIN